jgi:hypothetical protein
MLETLVAWIAYLLQIPFTWLVIASFISAMAESMWPVGIWCVWFFFYFLYVL